MKIAATALVWILVIVLLYLYIRESLFVARLSALAVANRNEIDRLNALVPNPNAPAGTPPVQTTPNP